MEGGVTVMVVALVREEWWLFEFQLTFQHSGLTESPAALQDVSVTDYISTHM